MLEDMPIMSVRLLTWGEDRCPCTFRWNARRRAWDLRAVRTNEMLRRVTETMNTREFALGMFNRSAYSHIHKALPAPYGWLRPGRRIHAERWGIWHV